MAKSYARFGRASGLHHVAGQPSVSRNVRAGRRLHSMRTLLKYVLVLAATYLAAWTGSYAFIFVSQGDGFKFTYYFEYLAAAWMFRAGELPFFIWLFSVIAFLPLAVLVVFLLRRYEKQERDVG